MKLKLEKKDGSISIIETLSVSFSEVGLAYYDAGHSIFISKDDYKFCNITEE